MTMTHMEWRNHRYYEFDPFAAEIQPALLNSSDIWNYVQKECLLDKGDFCRKRLKTASYEMRFLGDLHYWEMKNGKPQHRQEEIKENVKVNLLRNSIAYLWIKEKLYLPEYIAARFNLHIRYVHKGILLGTGPLVDPGFSGNLLIPLHNLTDNDYVLEGGEGIIWIEFTKLNINEHWRSEDKGRKRPEDLMEFPEIKDIDNPKKYFTKSSVMEAGGVQSAFKGALDRARRHAAGARIEARSTKKWVRNIGLTAVAVAAISFIISIAGVLFAGHNLINSATIKVQESSNEITNTRIDDHENRIRNVEKQLRDLVLQDMETRNPYPAQDKSEAELDER